MARQLRHDPEDGWHHVMNRGVDRQPVFFSDEDRVEFGQRLADVYERFAVETHAYCLMDNHFHLVIRCPEGGLSAAMQRVGGIYTQHVNGRLGRDGPLFRGRFASRPITDDPYLLTAIRYVHRNALDIPGVRTVDAYRWSSHRTYLGHRRRPPWLHIDHVLNAFGGDVNAFDQFVHEDGDQQVSNHPGAVELMRAAEFAATELDNCDARTVSACVQAIVTAALCDRNDRHALDAFLGTRSSGARRQAISRARRRIDASMDLQRILRRTVDLANATCDSWGQTPRVTRVTRGV